MTHVLGSDRSQLLLLPEAVDDYVAAANPVRFIDVFVDGLDLKAAGFERVEAKATGRPGYAVSNFVPNYLALPWHRILPSSLIVRTDLLVVVRTHPDA
jgi:hypothetical protein